MKNTLVTRVAAALLICAASAAAEEPFALYDANGVRMGRFAPFDTVQLTVNGQQYLVALAGVPKSTVALDFDTSPIVFESMDCTRPALTRFTRSYGAPFAIVQVKPSGRVMLHPAADKARYARTYSYRRGGGVCNFGQGYGLHVELQEPIDITDLYARPFTVR